MTTLDLHNNEEIIQEKIRIALDYDCLSYENFKQIAFQNWCASVAIKKGLHIQNLAINRGIRNFYNEQFLRLVEIPFYNEFEDYIEAAFWAENVKQNWNDEAQTAQVFEDLMFEKILQLHHIFPGVLIKTENNN